MVGKDVSFLVQYKFFTLLQSETVQQLVLFQVSALWQATDLLELLKNWQCVCGQMCLFSQTIIFEGRRLYGRLFEQHCLDKIMLQGGIMH